MFQQASQVSTETSHEKDGSLTLEMLDLYVLKQWTKEEQQAAKDLLCRSADVFCKSDLDFGKCNILTMTYSWQITTTLRRVQAHTTSSL